MISEKLNSNLIGISKREGIQKIVVGAVIQKKNQFLLLKRPPHEFMGGINELPSGNLEKEENLANALIREVKEETNLDINTIVKYLGHFDYFSKSGKKVRQFNFLVKVNKGKIILSEHEGYIWASKKDKDFTRLSEEVKKIISTI